MTTITITICPICGQINLCRPGQGICICPVCQAQSGTSDDMRIELID